MGKTNNLIKNIVIDIVIITIIWDFIKTPTYKIFFGLGASTYVLKKYI